MGKIVHTEAKSQIIKISSSAFLIVSGFPAIPWEDLFMLWFLLSLTSNSIEAYYTYLHYNIVSI